MRRRACAALAAVALTAAAAAADPVAPASLLITDARIFTGDPAHPWAEALAVRGDRIVAVGSRRDLEARFAGAARTVDAGGRTVIPGINDAHVHAPDLFHAVEATTGDDPSAAELRAALARAAASSPKDAWIHGTLGLRALDDPTLTRDLLDRIGGGHPIVLDNVAGHLMLVDSAALRRLGIGEQATPPLGGAYGRDARGRLDGRIWEYGRWAAMRRLAMALDDETIARSATAFSRAAARFGITTVQDMSNTLDARRLAAVLQRHPQPIRWRIIRFPIGAIEQPAPGPPADAGARVYVSGSKYILDGTPLERGAALRAPYDDRPGASGRLDFDAGAVRAMMRAALRSGEQLHLHTSGDRSLALILRAMEETGGAAVWRTRRLVLEHGDGLQPADFPRARRLGVVVVANPSHWMDPALMRRRIGRRLARWFPLRSLLAAGIPLALGSDGPLNPFLNIAFATQHPGRPGEALTRAEALGAYTRGAAFDEGRERDKGTLAPGMLADLAVLSQDPFTVPLSDLPRTHSVLTVVGGTVVYDELAAR